MPHIRRHCSNRAYKTNIMTPENLDMESMTAARRQAVEQTIQPISIAELKAIGEQIFPYHDHPWRDRFFQFLTENSGSTFYHATTNDPAEIIYCPAKDQGLWFRREGGMGPLQARALGILKEIVGPR
jgi:hypothetical protein